MSIFFEHNHLFLRNPRGGIENIAAMQAAGFGAIFCNVGDHPPDEWNTIRTRAATAGVACGPWLRTADENGKFDIARFQQLLGIADAWATPLIVNIETELLGSASILTSYINNSLGKRDAAISMEPWPFDNVNWVPLANRPILPQLFRATVDYAEATIRDTWHAYGINCVILTYGAYGGSTPDQYQRLAPYGVFAADDCGQNYAAWSQLGTTKPCFSTPPPPDPEPPMQTIGPQNGITASCNRLRDLDPAGTQLKKTDGKWPSITTLTQPLEQWKAYDKLERTLTILAAQHDIEATA